jgi:hypothetical protein
MTKITAALVLVVAVVVVGRAASASPTGRTGASGIAPAHTCNACHSGGADPTVTLYGPDSVMTGVPATYTLTITGGAGVVGGVDVAVDDTSAALGVASPGTRLAAGEVVHSQPLGFEGGYLSVELTLTAQHAGTLTLYAAGNSCDGDRTRFGDRAGFATQAVTAVGDPVALDGGAMMPVDTGPPPDEPPADPPSTGGCAFAGAFAFAGAGTRDGGGGGGGNGGGYAWGYALWLAFALALVRRRARKRTSA